MNARKLAGFIRREAGATLFGVEFIKRSDGSLRRMVCRLGVAKGVTGEGRKFDPLSKGLLGVYDIQAGGYRMVPLEGVQVLRIRGVAYDHNGKAVR